MKNKITLLFILTAACSAIAATYIIHKKREKRKMLEQVSDEGYETAPDILFPGKRGSSQLRYGPVIPG